MYSATIETAATPSQVFAALTEPELLKQWQPEAGEIKRPEGGLRVGATIQAVVEEFGRRFSVEFVIVALEPNARLAYHMTTPMWSGRIEYAIKERQPETSVSMLFVPDRPKVKGIVSHVVRAAALLTRPLMQWRLRSMLAGLRRVAEAHK